MRDSGPPFCKTNPLRFGASDLRIQAGRRELSPVSSKQRNGQAESSTASYDAALDRKLARTMLANTERIGRSLTPGSEPGRMRLFTRKYGHLYGSSVELAAYPG